MLRRLRARAFRAGVAESGGTPRLTTACADARSFTPPASGYDLVVTHFFLDCLTPAEALAARLRPHLAPGALWLVSEFEIPVGSPVRAALARAVIAFLYAAFRLLTGLRVRHIPPWRDALLRAGFERRSSRRWLGGLLAGELWQLREATASQAACSHRRVPATVAIFGSVPGQVPGPAPGIDPGPEPLPGIPPEPEPVPAPGPAPEPDPMPYPGPLPGPAPVT